MAYTNTRSGTTKILTSCPLDARSNYIRGHRRGAFCGREVPGCPDGMCNVKPAGPLPTRWLLQGLAAVLALRHPPPPPHLVVHFALKTQ